VFSAVSIREVPLLIGLEYRELVSSVGVRVKWRGEVEVRDWGSLLFSMEFGALATQFD